MSGGKPSDWVVRWSHLLPAGSTLLDVACGSGRHVRWFAAKGHRVTAVDRDAAALGTLTGVAETVAADIESSPWPFQGRTFDAVVVTNYLWRPLVPAILASVADGGVLLWETFADGQQHVGRPSNPDFLLRAGELLTACAGLRIVGYEHGFAGDPPRHVQRIAAIREGAPDRVPACYPLFAPFTFPPRPEGG